MPALEPGSIEVKTGMIYAQRPGYYFGYGMESDPEVLEALVGHQLNYELGAIATGQQLAVQEIDQLPLIPSDELGGNSVQDIIADSWARHTDTPFSGYTMRRGDNRGDLVKGTLYEVGMDDALALVDWSIALPRLEDARWRYWDHLVELVDDRRTMSLTAGDDQQVDRIVDGLKYDPFLIDRDITFKVIEYHVRNRGE